jgi:hypothetical protein
VAVIKYPKARPTTRAAIGMIMVSVEVSNNILLLFYSDAKRGEKKNLSVLKGKE